MNLKDTQNTTSLKSILDVKLDIQDKSHIHIHESVTNMAILVYLKTKMSDNQLNSSIQLQYLQLWIVVALIQIGMIVCITWTIIVDKCFWLSASEEYNLLLIKMFVSGVLHIMIYPEIA